MHDKCTGRSTHVSPWGLKPLINQPFPPSRTNKKKKTALGSVIFMFPVPSKHKASTSAILPDNTFIATRLLFSRPSLSGIFSHGGSCICWTPMLERLQSLSLDQTSVQSSVATGSWKHQVRRWSWGKFILHTSRPSSPAGRSLYTKTLRLEGIMTLKHFGS